MRRMSLCSWLVIASIALLAVFLLLSQACAPSRVTLHGSLFVSDAGRSHGGFEYNAEWNATLTVKDSSGTLKLVLHTGLGDALDKHEYSVTDFVMEPSRINMKIERQPVALIWVENDLVWGHMYDRYYIASWGSDSPPEEIRGTISPRYFPGLPDFWYVELRLSSA